ncbi:16939_t:CDS:2, partial [Racocetra fulgida]
HANLVYQEYIADRHHIHMNGTIWDTLTDFVKHLGREGTCVVDETPKGWFISWVDNSPKALARQEAILKKERAEKDEEERSRRLIEEQIERAQKEADNPGLDDEKFTELKRSNEEDKIKLNISLVKSESSVSSSTVKPDSSTTTTPSTNGSTHTSISFNKPTSQKMSLSALAKKSGSLNIIIDEMARKKRMEAMNENGNKRKDDQRDQRDKEKYKEDQREREKYKEDQKEREKYKEDQREREKYKEDQKEREKYKEDQREREKYKEDQRDREKYKEDQRDREKYKERRRERSRSYDRESKRVRRY